MDWRAGDWLYSYQGNYNAAGVLTLTSQIKAKCTGLNGQGQPIISVLTGSSAIKSGQRFIRVGSVSNTSRQSGMFFDTITANAPRFVLYDGFSSSSHFSDDYIIDPTLTISQIGKLDSVYDAQLGGYLTGQKGIYTKSLFANISGNSKLYIREDSDNYIYFDDGSLNIAATRFLLKSTNLFVGSGASAMILLGTSTPVYSAAKIGFKNDGSGKVASGNISWDTSGNVTQTGNWTSTATITGGTFQTAASGNRVVMDSSGLFGYHSTLGTVFSIPTDGSAPTFSSGVIKYTEFQIYTSGVIRTSSTVADGTSSSAGILINNTGIYGCGASQTTSTANVRILATGSAYFDGTITSIAGTIGGWTLASTSLTSTNIGLISGSGAMILLGHASSYSSAKIGFKNDGSGKVASGNISWDITGNVTQTGTWTSTATITGGTFQTAASGNRVVMNSFGLFGYHSTLGTVFSIPTDGSAPTFASGTIKETVIEIYTSGVLRTSATVADGTSSSYGVLINNTGIYGCGASQTTSTANVKILATTGELFAKLGTIGGWTIGAASLTSTNIGFHSGSSAMILLGHATDYASAKIGFKNDGSGKVASGSISWDTSGNVTQTGTWTSTATITGGTFQTAASGKRVEIDGTNNRLVFYDSSGNFAGSIYGNYGGLLFSSINTEGMIVTNPTTVGDCIQISDGDISFGTREMSGSFTPAATINKTIANYLDGVTSDVQTQINGKASASMGSATAIALYVTSSSGGSCTRQLKYRELAINGTTYNVLTTDS